MDVVLKLVTSDRDIAAYAAIRNQVVPCNPVSARELASVWRQAPECEAVVAESAGWAVGYGYVAAQHWMVDATTTECQVGVVREFRRRGVGTAIYDALSAWSDGRGFVGHDLVVVESNLDAAAYWEQRGFVEVFREVVTQCDLGEADLPDVVLPEGVRLVSRADRDDLDADVYAVASEAIGDSPGGEVDRYDAGDFAHWLASDFRSPTLIDDCTIVALNVHGVPIGYASLWRMDALPGVGLHSFTGVARAWRGRGVATALKVEQLHRARAAGMTAVRTENVEGNEPIRAINRRLGYRDLHTVRVLRGPLAAAR